MAEKKKDIPEVFKKVWVKLQWGRGEEFTVPYGILNFYKLENGDALHCELVRVEGEQKGKSKDINEEVLIDILSPRGEMHGRFPEGFFQRHSLEDYGSGTALLLIKKRIQNR